MKTTGKPDAMSWTNISPRLGSHSPFKLPRSPHELLDVLWQTTQFQLGQQQSKNEIDRLENGTRLGLTFGITLLLMCALAAVSLNGLRSFDEDVSAIT